MPIESDYQVKGANEKAPFTLKVHRGDGMCLLAMNWKNGKPPADFVGFAIEYQEPNGDRFYALKNRLSFPDKNGKPKKDQLSTRLSPIQKFRWVHFPRNANLDGDFIYKVTPVFMSKREELSYGESQQVAIQLRRETYKDQLNVAFTRGFVSSQAFVDRYGDDNSVSKLIAAKADDGLRFKPTHPKKDEALAWMGFEARESLLDILQAGADDPTATVSVIAYDLNVPEILNLMIKIGTRLRVIIDDSDPHGEPGSAETQAEKKLVASAGRENVLRQSMGKLQHYKVIIVDGNKIKAAIGGSTNFSWRGIYVQNNNAVTVYGEQAIKPFLIAFKSYWENSTSVAGFSATDSATRVSLGLSGINAEITFSPHNKDNAMLQEIADDISKNVQSSLFFSLAFLYQTKGAIRDAITKIKKNNKRFCYGLSDNLVDGLDVQLPNGKTSVLKPSALSKNIPEPFKSEPKGGKGIRMHHKFVVIDFDKPTARVYTGSYNFSGAADGANGENLFVIRDRKVATSYVVQALSMFDHYHFRLNQEKAKKTKKALMLAKPPVTAKGKPWWADYYTDTRRSLDRELFA